MGQALSLSSPRRSAGPSEASVPPNRPHLFIELEELHGQRWEERGRWNHAMEEDIEDGAAGRQKWSRPHLPTISVPGVMRLRQALSTENVRRATGP